MELISVQLLADRLLNEHELLKKGWRFSLDRAKRRAGCCRYSKKEITLAKAYAEQEELKEIKKIWDRNIILKNIDWRNWALNDNKTISPKHWPK